MPSMFWALSVVGKYESQLMDEHKVIERCKHHLDEYVNGIQSTGRGDQDKERNVYVAPAIDGNYLYFTVEFDWSTISFDRKTN